MIHRLKYLLPVLALSVAAPLYGEEAAAYTVEWDSAYYYNETAEVIIACNRELPADTEAVIEAWSRPPIGLSRKVAETRFKFNSPRKIVELRIRFDLDDYVLPEEAAAAVALMDIENEEEREQMIIELLPGGADGEYIQCYYIKLLINGTVRAESNAAWVIAEWLWD